MVLQKEWLAAEGSLTTVHLKCSAKASNIEDQFLMYGLKCYVKSFMMQNSHAGLQVDRTGLQDRRTGLQDQSTT